MVDYISEEKYTLPPLPYGYDALKPYISEEIMQLHHDKHHKAYVDNLNAALDKYNKTCNLKERIALLSIIHFNGGGHINHSFFWTILTPPATNKGCPYWVTDDATDLASTDDRQSAFLKALVDTFGGCARFRAAFKQAALGVQGSGWVWLGCHLESKALEIVTTANQDTLQSHTPILGVDLWEHAYYLQYKNDKGGYVDAIWNVINFEEAAKRFHKANVADNKL